MAYRRYRIVLVPKPGTEHMCQNVSGGSYASLEHARRDLPLVRIARKCDASIIDTETGKVVS